MSDEEISERRGSRISGGLVVAVVIAVVLVVFIFQNTDDAEVTWLVFDRKAPLWLVIVIAAVAGAVLSEVAGWVVRRRRGD